MKPVRMSTITKLLLSSALFGFVALAPGAVAEAQPAPYGFHNELRIRAGAFDPNGGSGYWEDNFRDFNGNSNDFVGGVFGVDYFREIAPLLDVMLGGSYYYAEHDLAYRNFEDEHGRSIIHTTSIGTSTADVGLVLRLAPRNAPIVPYVGGGGSAIAYRLEETGDFVDFGAHQPVIFQDSFHSQDVAFGWFALAGLDVPIGRTFSLFVEGRYQDAHANLTDDFSDFGDLDLTGTYVTFGAAWRF